jgi:hypothetical protein
MPRIDRVRLDPQKLVALAVRAELTRGELAARATVTGCTLRRAFGGLPIGVKVARAIARSLGSSIVELMASEQGAASSV